VDSRARGGDDRDMLEAWAEADMSTVARELGVPAELLRFLDEHDLRYEVIDGEILVNASPTFPHEDCRSQLFLQLLTAAPDDLAVLAEFAFFYDGLVAADTSNHTVADITVVRRADVEQQGTVLPPLLVVEVQSPSTKAKDVRIKRDIYERSGVPAYLLLHPVLKTLTVLELQDGHYVESHQAVPPAVVHLDRPFPVDLDLARVFRD
jgi:Uma2 family endonuclease